jgi:CTP:phosphocholine cytidylyltransferase-like protein
LTKALKSKVKKLLKENCSKRKNSKWYVKIDMPKNKKNLKTPILNIFKSTSFSISSLDEIA